MENSETVLVTGGSGAVAIHCILQLLQKGYKVKTTLRSISKKSEVTAMLKVGSIAASGSNSLANLSFIETDLGKDTNWAEAMTGCKYVLHVASPTHLGSKNEDDMIRPAVDGVLRVLKAARDAGVKRVVFTSSFGALGFSNKDRSVATTEANWTDPKEKGLSAYERSKGLSERAAWDFIKTEGGELELSVINPVAIFGPLLGPVRSPSLNIVRSLLNGSMKTVPNIHLNVIDIRDVADLHIRAMISPEAKGQRFIASADGEITMPQIAQLLRFKRPAISAKVSAKTLPNWIVAIAALFNAEAKHGALFLRISRNVSNTKAKKVLGWKPMGNNEDAILASADSMAKLGIIK